MYSITGDMFSIVYLILWTWGQVWYVMDLWFQPSPRLAAPSMFCMDGNRLLPAWTAWIHSIHLQSDFANATFYLDGFDTFLNICLPSCSDLHTIFYWFPEVHRRLLFADVSGCAACSDGCWLPTLHIGSVPSRRFCMRCVRSAQGWFVMGEDNWAVLRISSSDSSMLLVLQLLQLFVFSPVGPSIAVPFLMCLWLVAVLEWWIRWIWSTCIHSRKHQISELELGPRKQLCFEGWGDSGIAQIVWTGIFLSQAYSCSER